LPSIRAVPLGLALAQGLLPPKGASEVNERVDSCLVVGGGMIAARAVAPLLAAGIRVTVVSPRLAPALLEVAREGRLAWWPREYARDDVSGFARVVAATDDAAVNARVLGEAREHGLPVTSEAAVSRRYAGAE
jgi:uroporphyrin-III C-methyltransferase / precorrin-2 dehydrogenase / sirohydrochlorin ferrochelatase